MLLWCYVQILTLQKPHIPASFNMYLVINKWVIAIKVSNFSGQYLRNHWTLDIGVLGYIVIVWPKEHSPEVRSFPPGTPCICCEAKVTTHSWDYNTSNLRVFWLSPWHSWGLSIFWDSVPCYWELAPTFQESVVVLLSRVIYLVLLDNPPLKMEPLCCLPTSYTNYQGIHYHTYKKIKTSIPSSRHTNSTLFVWI